VTDTYFATDSDAHDAHEGDAAYDADALADEAVPATGDEAAWPAADLSAADAAAAQTPDEHVKIVQGGAESVSAQKVSISQGGAGRIDATEVTIEQGGAGLIRAGTLTLNGRSGAFAVAADEVTLNDNATAFLLIARTANGTLRTVVDWRAAAAFGAAFALVMALLRRGR
jgi:hypothetical protein